MTGSKLSSHSTKSPIKGGGQQDPTGFDILDNTGSFVVNDGYLTSPSFIGGNPSFSDSQRRDHHLPGPGNTSLESCNGSANSDVKKPSNSLSSPITIDASTRDSTNVATAPPQQQPSFHNYSHFQRHHAEQQKAAVTGTRALFTDKSSMLQSASELERRISAQKEAEFTYAVRKELINPTDGLLNPQAMLDSIAKDRRIAKTKLENEAKRRAKQKAEAQRLELVAKAAHLKGGRAGGKFDGVGGDNTDIEDSSGGGKRRTNNSKSSNRSPARAISSPRGKALPSPNATVMLDAEWRRLRLEAKEEAKRIEEMRRKPKLHEDDLDEDFGDISGLGASPNTGEDNVMLSHLKSQASKRSQMRGRGQKESKETAHHFTHRPEIPLPTATQRKQHQLKELADEALYEQHVADVEFDLPHNQRARQKNESTNCEDHGAQSGAQSSHTPLSPDHKGTSPKRFQPEQAFHKKLLAAALGRPKNIVTGFDDSGQEVVEHRTGGGLGSGEGVREAGGDDKRPGATIITEKDRYSNFADALGGLRISVVEAKTASGSLQHDSSLPVTTTAKRGSHKPSVPLSGPLPEELQPIVAMPWETRPSTSHRGPPRATGSRPTTAQVSAGGAVSLKTLSISQANVQKNNFEHFGFNATSPRTTREYSGVLNTFSPLPVRPPTAPATATPTHFPSFANNTFSSTTPSQLRGNSTSAAAQDPPIPNSARSKPPRHTLMSQLQRHQQQQQKGGGSLSAR